VACLLWSTGLAAAQVRDPIQGTVADLRLATSSVPSSSGWTPLLTTGSLVPSRGFGGGLDVQTFLGRGRYRRLGLGAASLAVQGRVTDAATATTVTTRMFSAGAQVSVNFGHRLGWSYLGGGVGAARVSSAVAGEPSAPRTGLAFHYGAGARWFLTDRLGVSMDLRFWALTPRRATVTRPNAAATTRVAFALGVAVR